MALGVRGRTPRRGELPLPEAQHAERPDDVGELGGPEALRRSERPRSLALSRTRPRSILRLPEIAYTSRFARVILDPEGGGPAGEARLQRPRPQLRREALQEVPHRGVLRPVRAGRTADNGSLRKRVLLLCEPLPRSPAAKTALQPLIWCPKSVSSRGNSYPEEFCFQTTIVTWRSA